MAGKSKRAKPSFFWQGALILAPVLVLFAVGVWTVWRDLETMEHEVRARMDPFANTLISAIQERLHPIRADRKQGNNYLSVSGMWFELRSDNSLAQSHLYTWPPTPAPFPSNLVDHLTSKAAELWLKASAAESSGAWSNVTAYYSAFAAIKEIIKPRRPGPFDHLSDERLRGEAYSRAAAAHVRLGESNLAVQAYDAVLRSFSPGIDTRSEAGLGLTHLAALRVFELTPDSANLPESWTTNTTQLLALLANDRSPFGKELALRFQEWLEPSESDLAVPPHLENQSEARKRDWRETRDAMFNVAERFEVKHWLDNQESWRLYHEAAAEFRNSAPAWPSLFWIDGDYPWLGIEQRIAKTAGRGRVFAAIPHAEINELLRRTLNQADPLGLYAVSLNLHGRIFSARETSQTDWNNRAISRSIDAPQDDLFINVALADPIGYFRAQRQRQYWLSGVMFAVAAACILAFISARIAFRRQVALNDQKSNFVSSVSHELRAPIASVRLMAESLERGKVSEPRKQQEYFQFIVQECRRLSSLIENVLDFSRIEQGRKQYEFEPTDVLALVRETVKLMDPYAAEREVVLKLETFNKDHSTLNIQGSEDSKLETQNLELILEIDGRAIQQALINLIDNAVKHSPKTQTVTIGIAPRRAEPTGPPTSSSRQSGNRVTRSERGVEISVTDRGLGIPAAEHEKIFERFYRLGSELRRETQGVGIGLSIVKHIVEAHGGRVRIQSEIGKGSCFTIELPNAHREDAETRRSR